MSNNTLSGELSEKIRSMANKSYGLGRIFNHLRKLKSCEQISDLGIFRLALCELKNSERLPSKNKIRYHFRNKVSKADWEGTSKNEVLEDLYNPTR